ncbi:MAG: hypothetical protein FJ033_05825 [Chloroflexi bacterium]|nr:hypothetical protein [Chloroflexota bacterium]
MIALQIRCFTVQEALSRRAILAGVLLSAAFLALFALGFAQLLGVVGGAPPSRETGAGRLPATMIFANLMTVSGMYAVHFLSSFLALLISVGSISGEIESGALLSILARPIRRADYLIGRWIGGVTLVCAYTIATGGAVIGISGAIAAYEAPAPFVALGYVCLNGALLITVGLLASTRLSTIASGVVLFSLFAIAWLGGLIKYIGGALGDAAVQNTGTFVSLLLPSDALWRAASYFVVTPLFILATTTASQRGGIPFVSPAPPSLAVVAWTCIYITILVAIAVVSLRRRDL